VYWPGREEHVRLAVVLLEAFDDDRPRRHVDAERERLGREDELQEPLLEQRLDDLLEQRHEPRMVRRDAVEQRPTPTAEPQHLEVLDGQLPEPLVDSGRDALPLLVGGETDPSLAELRDRVVAPLAGEHEHDGREPAATSELGGDLLARRPAQAATVAHTPTPSVDDTASAALLEHQDLRGSAHRPGPAQRARDVMRRRSCVTP
jgi:hypothetical protein